MPGPQAYPSFMLDPLPILPFTQPAEASVRLPGSKSITNRALLLAALGDGETELSGALFSEDTEIMVGALRELGFHVKADPGTERIVIRGEGGKIPARQARLFVGNAGTAARFLTAFCCLADGGEYELDGIPQMRKRPMKGLIDTLIALGAEVDSNNGHFPLRIRPNGLAGGEVQVDAAESSQMLSALLMVAPFARGDCTFKIAGVRQPFVLMTLRMMEQFGQPVFAANEGNFVTSENGKQQLRPGANQIRVPAGGHYRSPDNGHYAIEADVTAMRSRRMSPPPVTS